MRKIFKTILLAGFSILILYVATVGGKISDNYKISYTEFQEKAEHGDVEKVVIDGDKLKIYLYDSDYYYTTQYISDKEFVDYMNEQEIEVTKEEDSSNRGLSSFFSLFITLGFPLIMMYLLITMFTRNMNSGDEHGGGVGNIFSAGKNRSKEYMETETGVKFEDVAGQEEAKESLVEIIDYIHNPKKYQDIGAEIPKGALLVGPPGTGKTLMAKAMAGEAGVPFFYISGSDFVEMFVGVGASRVRDLFAEAKKKSPCIVFIDEIDAIGRARSSGGRVSSGNDEREQTLNQLLTEMDGFDSNSNIFILAATNRPEILDKALLRPGRFDREVIVDKPDLIGREAIFRVHIKKVAIDETVDLKAIAYATAGAVGADIKNIVNEAALRAVKLGRTAVSQEDLMESIETVIAGKEKNDRVMTEKERRLVSYHEVGHAFVAAMPKTSAPVQKITIVPRTKGSLGYTLQIPDEETFMSSKEEMYEEIKTLQGGRVAEEVFFNTITTGASNDIQKISNIARKMICKYGMSDNFGMIAFEDEGNYYLGESSSRNCSEKYSSMIDDEVVKITNDCYNETKKIIENNKKAITEIAEFLLEKENLTGDEFMTIFRKYYPDKDKSSKKIENTNNTKNNMKEEKKEEKKSSKLFSPIPLGSDFDKEDKKEENTEEKQEPLQIKKEEEKPLVVIQNDEQYEEPAQINDSDMPLDIMGDFEDSLPDLPSDSFDDIPMPDFDNPFEHNETKVDNSDKKEDLKNNKSEKSEELEEKKPEDKQKPAFEAPKPLQKKNKKNKGNKQEPPKKQEQPKESSKKDEQEKKPSDLDILMNGIKNNPQELAQKRKKGVYIDTSNKKDEKKNNGILNPDSKIENILEEKNNEITEDDY